MRTTLLSVFTALGAASFAHADQRGLRVVTEPAGTFLVADDSQSGGPGPAQRGTIRWTYSHPDSIPQTLAFSTLPGNLWVGQDLNAQRTQRFLLAGDGTPAVEFDGVPGGIIAVHAADDADVAAVITGTTNNFTLTAYDSSAEALLWSFPFDARFTGAGYAAVKVSRDGSRVCAIVYDSVATFSDLHIFDAVTGEVLNHWTVNAFANVIDLNDDGSLCMVTEGPRGRLIDTASGTQVFVASVSGAGGYNRVSGNSQTLVFGGFNMRVYVKSDSSYAFKFQVSQANTWFGWGLGVSRDGNTVAVMSHDYGAAYLKTSTRVYDVPSATLLGQYDTEGTGTYQDAISGCAVSDDGARFAVSSWGTQDNAHPELMIFDRACQLVGSIDTPGSVFSLDVSPDGSLVASGSKAVHANVFGRGGDTNLYEVGAPCNPCDMNCDGSINAQDIQPFREMLQGGGSQCAPCTGDTNNDGSINALDIQPFRDCLLNP